MNVKIRNATLKYIDAIMKIERDGFIPEIQENQEVFEKRLKVFPEGFFILEDLEREKGTEIGYFCSEIWTEKPESSSSFALGHDPEKVFDAKGKCFYISSVAVLKEYNGKGLGKKLFSHCVEKVLENYPEVSDLVLLVNDRWKGAQSIYKKNGFTEYDRLKDFFPDGGENKSDGILMENTAEKFHEALILQQKI